MAAGQGFKTFTTGEVLTAGDVNGYLMQGVLVFASAAARDAAITSPQEGQFAFTKDTNGLWYYDGAAWVASGATGDIEGVTAGVGISGGGTSGTVTVTNSMATAITTKGDLVVGTGSGTFVRQGIGANGTILTADSAEADGLKWAAAPTSGANWSSLGSAATTSGTTVTVSGISGVDKVMVLADGISSTSGSAEFAIQFNTDTASNYLCYGGYYKANATLGNTLQSINGSRASIPLGGISTNAASTLSGGLILTGCNASGKKAFQSSGVGGSSGGAVEMTAWWFTGYYDSSSTISSVSITCGAGTFDAGTLRIFTSA